MSSTPLICCSMGAATVSEMVWADAPGYCAVTTTVGGTTSGYSAIGRVRLIGSSPYEALLLPDTAIATDQSRKIVFVVKDDNTVEARAVELGPLDQGLRVIRTGLKPEDRVIIDGIQRARVGAKVSPHAAAGGGKK